MAPRKRGSRRIDAAFDAMRPYGFPVNLVQETVKELLDVYGGDAGWIFIEEASYTLLIETILEKQKYVAVYKVGQEIERTGDDGDDDEEASAMATPCHLNEAVNIPLLTDKAFGGGVEPLQSRPISQLIHTSQRRKPYHGWISSDAKEDDLVELPPAPISEEFRKLLLRSSKQKKRKSRWDVKPEDC